MAWKPETQDALAVIPARYGSTRFPGKPLAKDTGKYLIQHVVEKAGQALRIKRVVVATDDQRIFDAVKSFGAEAVMTRADHPNGTSRIAQVIASPAFAGFSIIVNVQGDEPDIEPRVIDELVEGLTVDTEAPMATLASPFADDEDPADPNIVKVVLATVKGRHRALYFSRSLIPYDRDRSTADLDRKLYLKHPGLYAYRRDFLPRYVALPPTPLEQTEQLEQLRALEHGHAIALVKTMVRHHGIDTPEQYEAFVQRHRLPSRT
ncbi:MAG: 3-deoxy-manno-octulosonate cytidylyltransferase [Phycisphaeraceae bacterium]